MKRAIFVILFMITSLMADFEQGEKLFKDKCSSCHIGYVSMKNLKKNFYEQNNTLLNLKAPTENMLVYAIMESSKAVGDKDDEEMRHIEIEEFLKNHLEDPNTLNTICEAHFFKFYATKSCDKIVLSDEEAELLATFFMEYKKPEEKRDEVVDFPSKEAKEILKKAKKEHKNIIIYASSKTCYFCKKMDKEVLELNDVKKRIEKDYIFVKVYTDEYKIPFGLNEGYEGLTPTFFFINDKQKRLSTYPGAWIKEDFLAILKESEPKK